MTVGELIEALKRFPSGNQVGATRGLMFAPMLLVQGRQMSEKYQGMVNRFDGEHGAGDRVVEFVFMSNSEVCALQDREAEKAEA